MVQETPNLIRFPQSQQTQQMLVSQALKLGCEKAKLIQTKHISVGHWVHLQCQYGCQHFGKLFTCPPCSPSTSETAEILADYDKALLIQAHKGSNPIEVGLALEENFRHKGFYKAFALNSRPCNLCEKCSIDTFCKYPEKARPTIQACGIDLNQTLLANDWGDHGPLRPCSDSSNIGLILLH
jgi:predicted metal-binding protein